MRPQLPAVLLALGLLAGCGGSPSGPSGPGPTPTPTAAGSAVAGVVFYDENGNGALDPGENVRLPAVGLTIGGQQAVTAAGGRFSLNVPAGARDAMVTVVPPFFHAGPLVSFSVPVSPGAEIAVPAELPIQRNRPNTYLAFGDSITIGDGSRTREGYRDAFQAAVGSFWGRADVINDGIESSKSDQGADRMGQSLQKERPAYALILYGTNDWNNLFCHNAVKCGTPNAIRSMIRQCKANGTVPVVGTIIPANPAFEDRDAFQRNAWIDEMNGYIRTAVREEGGVLAETHDAFTRGAAGNLPAYFSDHVHPNDDGYAFIAQAFFTAVTTPVPAGQ